ncbi:zinc-ribbon domain-containing protein [Halolamina salina]|uniref:Zinc-ribbon domain-containing protein n=1 Tax=Halolamina salina TaxID=1220023 RepID=A0ABD6BAE4_9EURY
MVRTVRKRIADRIAPSSTTCSACGIEIPDDSIFCPRCGAREPDAGEPGVVIRGVSEETSEALTDALQEVGVDEDLIQYE